MHVSYSPITCTNRFSPSGFVFKNYIFNAWLSCISNYYLKLDADIRKVWLKIRIGVKTYLILTTMGISGEQFFPLVSL